VFKNNWIQTGEGGICVGMMNGYLVRIHDQRLLYSWQVIPSPITSDFHPFPHNDSYSKCAWDNIVCLSWLTSFKLGRSSITQSSRQNILIDYSLADWNYLHYRLHIPNADTCIEKDGISTHLFIQRNGTKEVLIKCLVCKQTYRMDTSQLFEHLTGVLGLDRRLKLDFAFQIYGLPQCCVVPR
jgi:hypothetical protein